MGRRKIEIKPIKDDRNRSVTFLKRKGGLFKKAHELSVLCSVDVAVIIYGSNKKLYQYCNGDVVEMVGRHQMTMKFDQPHESKGPKDFMDKDKKDTPDDDDDDDENVPLDREQSHASNDHQMNPQFHQQHPGLNHLNRHTASASPPHMARGMPAQGPYPSMHSRTGTPQPPRPASRNAVQRRNSSHPVPPNAYPVNQPPQHNGMYPSSYMSHAPVYTTQSQGVVPMQPTMNHVEYPSYQQQQRQQQLHHHHQQQQQQQPQSQSQPQPQPDPRAVADAYIRNVDPQPAPIMYPQEPQGEIQPAQEPAMPMATADKEPKRAPAKSRSMFTPIGPSESMLAARFMINGGHDQARSNSIDVGQMQRRTVAEQKPPTLKEEKTAPAPIKISPPPPPTRNNSMTDPKSAGMRPKLKVQIPSPADGAGSVTESPRAASAAGNLSARPHDGPVVLPPPSPSVSALLSAGATGPTNPFSRGPPPPVSTAPGETPISALPSRFTESILPSPGGFYADWNLPFSHPRGGNNDNILPSPLNFTATTPTLPNSNAWSRDPPPAVNNDTNANGKRGSPEGSPEAAAKRARV